MLAIKGMRMATIQNKWQTPPPGAGMSVSSYINAFAVTRINIRRREQQ